MDDFSDYIVFADESGDHGMHQIDPQFPIFSLVFCVFEKRRYAEEVEPAVRALKFKYFGHDAIVLHEREIRKEQAPFTFLRRDKTLRDAFYADLNTLMAGVPMIWFASVIHKQRHRDKYLDPWNPYEIAMQFCMEKVWNLMIKRGQRARLLHILFEARGGNEDRDLELEFRRVTANEAHWGWRQVDYTQVPMEPVFVSKHGNMAGHQITDLMARPLALKHLRPEQPNRAVEAIWPQMGYFKTFP